MLPHHLIVWSVCVWLFVGHSREPCKNGWTDCGAVWDVGQRNHVLGGGPDLHMGMGILGGTPWTVVMHRDIHTHTLLVLHPFNDLFSRTTWVSRYQKGKTSLYLNEARDDGVLGCSGISWAICKQSAPRSRQITTPTPHHSVFTGRMLFLTPNQRCQSTEGTDIHTHCW